MNSAPPATKRPRVRPTVIAITLTIAAAAGWIATAESTTMQHERAAMIIVFVSGAIISVASWISQRYADHLAAIAAELAANNERWEHRRDEAYRRGYMDGMRRRGPGDPPLLRSV